PAVLATLEQPLVLAVGSSGTFRSLSPADFEAEAARAGQAVACLNAGLPQISARGLNRVCRHVLEACERRGVRLAAAIFELDPMHISVVPPRRDIDLPESFFTGAVQPFADGELDPEFEWSAQSRGAWN